jgi:2'-5' RNA ligase
MRAFLSINLTSELHRAVEELQSRLEPSISGIRWTKPENVHLTLKFFGDIVAQDVDTIVSCLNPITAEFSAFPVEFSGVGRFPEKGVLSILWIGSQRGKIELIAIEQAIRESLIRAKCSFDKKSFIPHLTIGRAMRNQKPHIHQWEKHKNITLGEMTVDSFCLMESQLTPSGPVYSVVHRFELNS